jgi:branched-chain amino acid transport system permease protein
MTSSLRLINLSGQGSLGHAGLMCIGAYVSAILARELEWSPWLTICAGILATFIVTFLIAIPFTRLRGIYFTMISLFFSIGVLALIRVFTDFTGGYAGLSGIPPLLGMSKVSYYYLYLLVAVICLLVMYRLEFSRIGLNWKAVAQSHMVASSIGINETRQRIVCLSIGGFFAGVAGAFYAHYYLILSQDTFGIFTSIYVFIYMMVGGVHSFAGPIIGTAVLIIAPEVFRSLREYVPFLFAGILLLVLFFMPRGLAGLPKQIGAWLCKKRKRDGGDHAP